MTISRKSMLSNSSCSRNGLSSARPLRSSSGAITLKISRVSLRISAGVIAQQNPSLETCDDNYGVDAEHPERIVQNVPGTIQLARLIEHQPRQGALRIQLVDINGRMANAIVKCAEIASQFEGTSGTHRMADKALGVI